MKHTEAFFRRVIDSLCDGGFMHGWFGDKSEEFRRSQAKNYTCLASQGVGYVEATLNADIPNLCLSCGWSRKDCDTLAEYFGFRILWAGKSSNPFPERVELDDREQS